MYVDCNGCPLSPTKGLAGSGEFLRVPCFDPSSLPRGRGFRELKVISRHSSRAESVLFHHSRSVGARRLVMPAGGASHEGPLRFIAIPYLIVRGHAEMHPPTPVFCVVCLRGLAFALRQASV